MRITPNIDSGIFLQCNGYGMKHKKRQINVPE
jgi:hypothetical protein